jgi:hypothetical protein
MKKILNYLFCDNSETTKRLNELEYKIKQLEYLIENPAKYKKGQLLEDGTLIINVGKLTRPCLVYSDGSKSFMGWDWYYVGVKDNQIINLK